MKVVAYLTSCCNTVQLEDNVKGVISTPNMFDSFAQYKTVNPDKSTIHYCVQCYTSNVIEAANHYLVSELINTNPDMYKRRKQTPAELDAKRKELSYVFLKSLFSRATLIP